MDNLAEYERISFTVQDYQGYYRIALQGASSLTTTSFDQNSMPLFNLKLGNLLWPIVLVMQKNLPAQVRFPSQTWPSRNRGPCP